MTNWRDSAEPIGELDGATYHRIAVIVRRAADGVWDDLGPEADWRGTLEARLIAAQRELAELRAQLAAREAAREAALEAAARVAHQALLDRQPGGVPNGEAACEALFQALVKEAPNA